MTILAEERYWIEAGQLVATPAVLDNNIAVVEERLHRLGHVRIVSGPLGTEVKWSTFAPCHSSLFAAMEWLAHARAPVILRYYFSGWFEEAGLTTEQARARIDHIMLYGDQKLNKRTFIFSKLPNLAELPPLIRKCWDEGKPSYEHAVDCVYHEETDQYFVERIGEKSAIATYFGLSKASFPCQAANSFSEAVKAAYDVAFVTKQPVYDQILASLPLSPRVFRWMPYHRIVFPVQGTNGARRVSVISEVAPIDFRLI